MSSSTSKKISFLLFVLTLFLFRILYGLNLDFWNDDEKQIYLLGLELYHEKSWPYFGADVIHTKSQIAGALQSLLVGLPFFFLPVPEAPFLLLNVLSLFAVFLLAWLIKRVYPSYSLPWLMLYLGSLPWALEISTHIYNPSYLLLPAVLFLVAYASILLPAYGLVLPIDLRFAWFLIAFSLAQMIQLHLSWPLLLPFAGIAFLYSLRRMHFISLAASAAAGLALPMALLFPSFYEFGVKKCMEAGQSNLTFNLENLLGFFHNLTRLLSFSSYELFMFLGERGEQRLEFLLNFKPLFLLFVPLSLLWIVQSVYFLYVSSQKLYSPKKDPERFSIELFWLALLVLMLTFLFSARPPVSRNAYLFFPFVVLASFTAVDRLMGKNGQRLFKIVTVASLLYHSGVTYTRYKYYPQSTLYSNRELLVKALDEPSLFSKPRYPEYGRK